MTPVFPCPVFAVSVYSEPERMIGSIVYESGRYSRQNSSRDLKGVGLRYSSMSTSASAPGSGAGNELMRLLVECRPHIIDVANNFGRGEEDLDACIGPALGACHRRVDVDAAIIGLAQDGQTIDPSEHRDPRRSRPRTQAPKPDETKKPSRRARSRYPPAMVRPWVTSSSRSSLTAAPPRSAELRLPSVSAGTLELLPSDAGDGISGINGSKGCHERGDPDALATVVAPERVDEIATRDRDEVAGRDRGYSDLARPRCRRGPRCVPNLERVLNALCFGIIVRPAACRGGALRGRARLKSSLSSNRQPRRRNSSRTLRGSQPPKQFTTMRRSPSSRMLRLGLRSPRPLPWLGTGHRQR